MDHASPPAAAEHAFLGRAGAMGEPWENRVAWFEEPMAPWSPDSVSARTPLGPAVIGRILSECSPHSGQGRGPTSTQTTVASDWVLEPDGVL
ncbi:MAG: hypothetical protein QOE07_2510 [Acidimicrobiaceae bacterium]|nr:hypothetical protein [Acidimicrobiaceae bacterium]MDQ1413922.1 hypothetical protein [Acidimicrobiaceae bacterium]MDQ1442787.1 hypothetical protein [Acidimicrobiaceae bacterium]